MISASLVSFRFSRHESHTLHFLWKGLPSKTKQSQITGYKFTECHVCPILYTQTITKSENSVISMKRAQNARVCRAEHVLAKSHFPAPQISKSSYWPAISMIIVSITKFSIVISHPRTYFLRNWRAVT